MEDIKISKVPDVALFRKGRSSRGTLHLTAHHMIFQLDDDATDGDTDTLAAAVGGVSLKQEPEKGKDGKSSNGHASQGQTLDSRKDSQKDSQLDNVNGDTDPLSQSQNSNDSDKKEDDNKEDDNKEDDIKEDKKDTKEPTKSPEIWISYPIISSVEKKNGVIRVRCRDFTYLAFHLHNESEAKDVFDSIQKLCCPSTIERLYAFYYKPGKSERRFNGWAAFNPQQEFARQGAFAKDKWRMTALNENYALCATYPRQLAVPASVSDNVLNYAARFRSKNRLPVLSFHNAFNGCTITRCSQPLVGLKKNRSPQDEKVVAEIFGTTVNSEYETPRDNLIVDARPVANAVAQQALGAGSENTDNYARGCCTKHYLGIDNIHVMRDSLSKVVDVLKDGDYGDFDFASRKDALVRSQWLKYTTIILEGAVLMAKALHLEFKHVLLHCSDGWDRTAQLSCLAQIMVDPYFRTLNGFMVLVEKEWLAFGHQFNERSGHLNGPRSFVDLTEKKPASQSAFSDFMSAARAATQAATQAATSSNHLKNTSPVFHQFLDCVYQLVRQYPDRFEYSERFLRRLYYHLHSCQYGTFLYDNEKQRVQNRVFERTTSVWNYFLARRNQFINPKYDAESEMALSATLDALILPDVGQVTWWHQLFGISEDEVSEVGAGAGSGLAGSANSINGHEEETKEEVEAAVAKGKKNGETEAEAKKDTEEVTSGTAGAVMTAKVSEKTALATDNTAQPSTAKTTAKPSTGTTEAEPPVEEGNALSDITPRSKMEKKTVHIQPLSNTSVEYASYE